MNQNHPAIHICPIKALYQSLPGRSERSRIAAIMCSESTIKVEKLQGILYIVKQFADTLRLEPTAFDAAAAKEIADFVDSMPDEIADLYVCCDAGQSRSAAVAAAIMRYWDMDDGKVWKNPQYHPNILVYRLQTRAFGIPLSEEQCTQLQRMNDEAFADAIRRAREG